MVSPQSQITTYRYDAVGNRDSVINPNGVSSGYQYDALNRLTRVRHYKAGSVLAHYAYALNAAGIRTQVTEKDSSKVIYGYDSLYRLKSERRTGNHTDTMTYTYDQVGNRLTKLRRGVTTTYAYNNRDQMLSEWDGTDSTLYSYDAAGRMLTKAEVGGTTNYRWRDEDRLDSLYGPGVSVKYQYDADGKRVKDSTGSTVRQYLIDPLLPYGQVIAETDGSNSLVAEYTYGADRVSLRRSGAAHYYLADGQGSTRLLTDSTGTATDSTVYTAFGETLFSSGSTPNRFSYVGEEFDPNAQFYYLRDRWMNPDIGRFASTDPEDGCPMCPQSLHRYGYAEQSPVSKSDPSGRITLVDLMGSISIQNVLKLSNRAIKVQQGRRIAVKAGCIVLEEIFETVITEGVYIILIEGVPYVGQSNDIPRRLKEHARRYGEQAIKVVETFGMKGSSKAARELFEQLVIDEFDKADVKLRNQVDPVSSARRISKKFADKIGGIFKFCK